MNTIDKIRKICTTYSKWTDAESAICEILNECDSVNKDAENDLISSVIDWVANSERPKFDGNYLCYIHQPQECGNVWVYYRTVYREMGKWVLNENEEVIFWTNKAFPTYPSPEPPIK